MNGRVERKHRHILNVARACLFQTRLPVTFWGESILTAAHLINRTVSQVLQGKTPYELLFGKKPDYDQFCVFGCLCYSHQKARDKDKFSDRSRKCMFMGYSYGKKAWKLYDLDTQEYFTSRDVKFSETKFPGVHIDEYVTPAMNHYDPRIDDWLLPDLSSRGSSSILPPSLSSGPDCTVTTNTETTTETTPMTTAEILPTQPEPTPTFPTLP